MPATFHEEIVFDGQPAAHHTFRLDTSHQPPPAATPRSSTAPYGTPGWWKGLAS
jgi:hypothetical protein